MYGASGTDNLLITEPDSFVFAEWPRLCSFVPNEEMY